MSTDPVETALRHVVETRDLLKNLITSSEEFDYYAAKEALVQLQRKIRDLGKFQAQLEIGRPQPEPNVSVVQFREQEFWPEAD